MNAREQLLAVLRYHRHTQLQGRALTLEQAACEWIRRYAGLWREHLDRRGPAPKAQALTGVGLRARRCD